VPYDYLITGAVTAFFVSLIIVSLIIFFLSHMKASREKDSTQLLRAEEQNSRLAAALQQAGDGIYIMDTEMKIIYVNPAFTLITGYAAGEVIGREAAIMRSVHSDVNYAEMRRKAMQGETWSGTCVNTAKGGVIFESKTTVAPISDAVGRIINFVAVMRDVTREELLKRARDYFTAITSHELRTPLAKLQLARLLLDDLNVGADDVAALNNIGSMLDGLYKEMERIVSATTLISTLRMSHTQKEFTPIYIYLVALNSINHARDALTRDGRKLAIEVNLDALPKETETLADQSLLLRAMEEMLSNAVKYTPDGGIIRVSGRVANGEVLMEVADEGNGIPPEQISHVFEPFFSFENPELHSSGNYKYQGGGIGLGFTITHMIMDLHGGGISIKSGGVGMGTTVTLALPVMGAKKP
jgi:two-component system sensor histidine kinase VicK